MKIFIDWKNINSFEDFYHVFLPQVEAPDWHGKNLDALYDSLVSGGINKIEPPFCVINKNVAFVSPKAEEVYYATKEIFREANDMGRKIRVFEE